MVFYGKTLLMYLAEEWVKFASINEGNLLMFIHRINHGLVKYLTSHATVKKLPNTDYPRSKS